jgi:hypothetical protein
MEEYKINENKILEELSEVTTAKRVARMVSFLKYRHSSIEHITKVHSFEASS